jgi:hypothetical protein
MRRVIGPPKLQIKPCLIPKRPFVLPAFLGEMQENGGARLGEQFGSTPLRHPFVLCNVLFIASRMLVVIGKWRTKILWHHAAYRISICTDPCKPQRLERT